MTFLNSYVVAFVTVLYKLTYKLRGKVGYFHNEEESVSFLVFECLTLVVQHVKVSYSFANRLF